MHRHTRIALFILCGIFAAFASAAATQRADAAKIWHAPGSHDLRARTIKKIVPRYTASRKTHRGQRYTGFKKVHRGQLYTGFKKVHRGQRYTGFKKVHRGQRYTGFKKVYSGPRYLSQSY